jgi:hypothetical protein
MFLVESVAFSQTRNILAAGGGGGAILLWNVADPAHPVRLGRRALHGAVSNVSSVAISPDGELLAAASGTSVGLWSLADPGDPAPVTTLSGPTKSVSKVAFGQDGKILAAGSADTKVWLWTLADTAHPAPLGQPLTTQPDMVDAERRHPGMEPGRRRGHPADLRYHQPCSHGPAVEPVLPDAIPRALRAPRPLWPADTVTRASAALCSARLAGLFTPLCISGALPSPRQRKATREWGTR